MFGSSITFPQRHRWVGIKNFMHKHKKSSDESTPLACMHEKIIDFLWKWKKKGKVKTRHSQTTGNASHPCRFQSLDTCGVAGPSFHIPEYMDPHPCGD